MDIERFLTDDTRGKSPAEIYADALTAAKEAATVVNERLGPENARGFDCGFGWVEINPATAPFVKYCKANGIGSKHWKRGWSIWSPAGATTQSISVHYAGARAFARVLQHHGINAVACSRLD